MNIREIIQHKSSLNRVYDFFNYRNFYFLPDRNSTYAFLSEDKFMYAMSFCKDRFVNNVIVSDEVNLFKTYDIPIVNLAQFRRYTAHIALTKKIHVWIPDIRYDTFLIEAYNQIRENDLGGVSNLRFFLNAHDKNPSDLVIQTFLLDSTYLVL